ncbi:AzlD domain-containing protein [Celerinatantimonas sp. YJH-8]|uniref:AzlD domain-containing protein n=1 Tax=Celerinatantimonas sp. YJH-8 TaxID=3228714 RepID=UPI0038CA34D5
MSQHLIWGILLLAAGTYLFRLAGPLLGNRFQFSEPMQHMTTRFSTVLLFTVAVLATFYDGKLYAGHAHVIGVMVSAVLAYKRLPFLVVVLSAALVTAGLRWIGLP